MVSQRGSGKTLLSGTWGGGEGWGDGGRGVSHGGLLWVPSYTSRPGCIAIDLVGL